MRKLASSVFDVNGTDVAFIHIPKTGGQSVYKAFNVRKRWHLPIDCEPRRSEMLQCGYSFAIVRNPYSRAVSLFYWLAQLHLRPTRRGPANAAFNQWCRNTDVNSFWKQVDVAYANRHMPMFQTQTYFLRREDGKVHPRVNVFKFEEMAKSWGIITNTLEVDFRLPHINKSKHRVVRDELTEETKTIIARIYKEDFDNFYPELVERAADNQYAPVKEVDDNKIMNLKND